MNWASSAIQALKEGKQTQIRPHGQSMKGKVESGSLVTLKPYEDDLPQLGDIVLVKVNGRVYLHLIKALKFEGTDKARFLIGNNRGGVNGWVSRDSLYGVAIKIEA